jgi:hypothetical protein
MDQAMPRDAKSKVWSDWIYYVQCHALRKEAEGVLHAAGLSTTSRRFTTPIAGHGKTTVNAFTTNRGAASSGGLRASVNDLGRRFISLHYYILFTDRGDDVQGRALSRCTIAA